MTWHMSQQHTFVPDCIIKLKILAKLFPSYLAYNHELVNYLLLITCDIVVYCKDIQNEFPDKKIYEFDIKYFHHKSNKN